MARVVVPPIEELRALRQPLTLGERRVVDWFIELLPSGWEIYIQPHLNGLRPDVVLLHPKCGIAVYEIKDWTLHSVHRYVRQGRVGPVLMGRKDGRDFSLAKQDPVAKIEQYKDELYGLYVPSLPAGNGLGSIVAGVIFTDAPTDAVLDLLGPLRKFRRQSEYPKLYPVVGSELIGDLSKDALRAVLSCASRLDDRMTDRVAAELRHWLVEPSFSSEQRDPLAKCMTKRQRALAVNEDNVRFRRIKGPAGSGKSLVIAGRAAELAAAGKRVLVVTFNITLINYLLDLAVRYAQSGAIRDQITALNFHYWCKRVASDAGRDKEYDELWSAIDPEDADSSRMVLEVTLPRAATQWAASLDDEDRWDAILVDEGQDFLPGWWSALRAALPSDGSGEAMLAADAQQNIYAVAPWTESDMTGAGFRGRWVTLDHSYRLSPSLCGLASEFVQQFLPDAADHRPVPPDGQFEFKTVLRWRQVGAADNMADQCVAALIGILEASGDDPVAAADLVCIVDKDEVGLDVVSRLREKRIFAIHTFGHGRSKREREEDSRRRKLAFYKGDARIKVTTVQSFKGWESRALVLLISDAKNRGSLALAYAGITRLRRDDHGCYLTVVCAAPQLAEYSKLWPA